MVLYLHPYLHPLDEWVENGYFSLIFKFFVCILYTSVNYYLMIRLRLFYFIFLSLHQKYIGKKFHSSRNPKRTSDWSTILSSTLI